MKPYKVEILLKDSSCYHHYENVVSMHEEGSYSVLVLGDGVVVKWPTRLIFRFKLFPKKAGK